MPRSSLASKPGLRWIRGVVVSLFSENSIDAQKAAAVAEEIKAGGGEAIVVTGDVGADDFPERIVDATVK